MQACEDGRGVNGTWGYGVACGIYESVGIGRVGGSVIAGFWE